MYLCNFPFTCLSASLSRLLSHSLAIFCVFNSSLSRDALLRFLFFFPLLPLALALPLALPRPLPPSLYLPIPFKQVMWFVAEAMTDVGVPDAVVNSPAGMAFLERVGKPVYESLRVLCLNRARQRSSLEIQMQVYRERRLQHPPLLIQLDVCLWCRPF